MQKNQKEEEPLGRRIRQQTQHSHTLAPVQRNSEGRFQMLICRRSNMQCKYSLWQNHRPSEISSQSITKMERNRHWKFLQILRHRDQNPQRLKIFQKIQKPILELGAN